MRVQVVRFRPLTRGGCAPGAWHESCATYAALFWGLTHSSFNIYMDLDMMNKHALLAAALSLGTISVAMADDAKSDWTFTGNAGLFSDYRFRGYTQTNYKPAFQGGFDLGHSSGFYVGNWNSNVEQDLYRGASMESDLYGGYKYNLGPVALDAGVLDYVYLTSHAANVTKGTGKKANQTELYIDATYDIVTVKYSYGLTNFFGEGDGVGIDTSGNYYFDLSLNKDLGDGWGVNAHYGYQYIKNNTEYTKLYATTKQSNDVSDYRLGVTKDLSGWTAAATLVATSKKDYYGTGVSAGAQGAGRTSVVASVSKTF